MVKYENDCIGCAAPGYPCLGESCRYRNVKHFTVMIAEMM